MKKYFLKIIAEALIAVVLFLGSSFCFQGLLGSLVEIKEVHAAPVDDNLMNDSGTCAREQAAEGQMANEPAPEHNSVLPCCIDGSHPSVIASTQSPEISKLIPVTFFNVSLPASEIIKETVSYSSPIMSPPELVSIRTTILRL